MDTKQILNQLRKERNRLDQAIAAIENLGSNSKGAFAGPARKTLRSRRGRMSAAARKRLSELMKKRWASGKMGRRKARPAA